MSLLQSSVRSHWPDTRDVWTDTESDDVSDSGVQSLPSSESDGGVHYMKMVRRLVKYGGVGRALLVFVLRSTQNT
jgi:hypothetical protein